MARVNVPVTQITRAGEAPPAEVNGDATNGHDFTNDGKTFLLVRNADGTAAHTVTIVTPGTVDGLAIADRAVSIPLSQSRYIGPFPPAVYGVDGRVQADVTSAQLKLSALRLP